MKGGREEGRKGGREEGRKEGRETKRKRDREQGLNALHFICFKTH
jgi:hypothetical protein